MPTETIYLFICGSGFKGAGLFALTRDRSGGNLPKAHCPAGWAFDKSIDAIERAVAGIAIDAKAALADIAKTGYHLLYVKGADASAGTDKPSV